MPQEQRDSLFKISCVTPQNLAEYTKYDQDIAAWMDTLIAERSVQHRARSAGRARARRSCRRRSQARRASPPRRPAAADATDIDIGAPAAARRPIPTEGLEVSNQMNARSPAGVVADEAPATSSSGGSGRRRIDLKRLGEVGAFVVLVVVFTALNPATFLTANNIQTILDQAAIPLIIAVGATLVILMGSIDLSVEGVMGAAGMTFVLMTANSRGSDDYGVPTALVVALVVGAGAGAAERDDPHPAEGAVLHRDARRLVRRPGHRHAAVRDRIHPVPRQRRPQAVAEHHHCRAAQLVLGRGADRGAGGRGGAVHGGSADSPTPSATTSRSPRPTASRWRATRSSSSSSRGRAARWPVCSRASSSGPGRRRWASAACS